MAGRSKIRSIDSDLTPPSRTAGHYIWLTWSYMITFFVPNFILSAIGLRTDFARRAWRQKVGLFVLALALGGGLVVLVEYVSPIFCSNSIYLTPDQLASTNFVSVHGKIADFKSRSTSTKAAALAAPFAGKDVSDLFPSIVALGRLPNSTIYPNNDIMELVGGNYAIADAWLSAFFESHKNTITLFSNRSLHLCAGPLSSIADTPCLVGKQDMVALSNAIVGGKSHRRK